MNGFRKAISPQDLRLDPEGGRAGGPDSPEKSQVIWVSIGNKQLDHPWKKLEPLQLEI